MSGNEVRIEVYGENRAGPAFKSVADDAERAERAVRSLSERTDDLDESSSHATSALGALGSGFELIGQTGIQTTLESAALATDFFSGVGEGATLVVEKFKGGLSAAQGGLKNFGANLRDGETRIGGFARGAAAGAVAVGVLLAATNAVGAAFGSQLNPQIDVLNRGFREFSETSRLSGEAARVFGADAGHLDDALKSVADTGRWSSFSRGFAGAIEGVTGAGKLFDDSLEHNQERITALDGTLIDLVHSGNTQQAADLFGEIAKRAREQGVSVDELKKVFPQYAAALEDGSAAAKDFGENTMTTVDALNQQDDAINEVANSLKAQTDPLYGYIDAQATLTEKQNDYNKAVKTHGQNSKEARAASDALNRALISMVTSAARASNGTGHLTAQQKALLASAGASKTRIAELDAQLYAAWRQANKLDGFNIDINYNQHFRMFGKPYSQAAIDSGNIGGLASGGVKGAASGMAGSGLTWVGEHGPELVNMPAGSVVHSNPDSMRMAQQAGGQGGQLEIVLVAAPSAESGLMSAILKALRYEIRSQGGNVQQVLGVQGR